MQTGKILVIDDDVISRQFLNSFLIYKGYEVLLANDGVEGVEMVVSNDIDLVITDIMMPRLNGLETIKQIKSKFPEIITIAYSAFINHEMKVNLLNAGAFVCLEKPFNLEEMETHVKRGLEHQNLRQQALKSKPVIKNRQLMKNIIGESEKMLSLLELVEKVAESDSTVLIQGESGTGKELFARAIHDLSSRRNRNFVPVNSAAIPDDLLESELFGHVKGAFTGATANRIGRFEMADRGTFFLDEIGDMKLSLQVKILRVLQNREIEPVGGMQMRKINTRVIAATNQNLESLVEKKQFREDLFYRLSVIPIVIPPLRERKEDIPLLIESFLKRMNSEKKRTVSGLDREAMSILCNYNWPGNIRELENLIERLVIIKGSGVITAVDLPSKYVGKTDVAPKEVFHLPTEGIYFNTAMEEFENRLISEALQKSGGNKKEAAQLLNLKRTTFIEKLKKKNFNNDYNMAANS